MQWVPRSERDRAGPPSGARISVQHQSLVLCQLRAICTWVRTKAPVSAASVQGLASSKKADPAMSMLTKGLPATNSSKDLAAVIDPPTMLTFGSFGRWWFHKLGERSSLGGWHLSFGPRLPIHATNDFFAGGEKQLPQFVALFWMHINGVRGEDLELVDSSKLLLRRFAQQTSCQQIAA